MAPESGLSWCDATAPELMAMEQVPALLPVETAAVTVVKQEQVNEVLYPALNATSG